MKSVVSRKRQPEAVRAKKEDLRAKILDAARELFVNEGVEAVSMRKIAERIGYSATTLYNYFTDKEALLFALCDADFIALHESFKKIGKIADPMERLRKLGEVYIAFAMNFPSHYRLMFMTPRIPRSEDIRSAIERGNPDQDSYAFLRDTVIEALASGHFRAEFQDPDLLSQVVWSGVHGVAALNLIMGKDDWVQWRPVEEVARTAMDVMVRGLVRDGGSPKPRADND